MSRFIIHGGKALKGVYRASGNKNAVLPMLAASILTDKPITLYNVPQIEDVLTMLEILDSMGSDVSIRGHTVKLCAKSLRNVTPPKELCSRLRGSFLLAGPLITRFRNASIYPPGGDSIGRRPLDTHLHAFSSMGVKFSGKTPFIFKANQLRGNNIVLPEASVTATENAIMTAVMAKGTTTLYNCACEPHVQDLCKLLNKMGARIEGIGTNLLSIHGVNELSGTSFYVSGDYVEAGSFIVASALTGGKITIENAPVSELNIIKSTFTKLCIKWNVVASDTIRLKHPSVLRVRNDFGTAIPKIEDGVWPSFPSDLMSILIVAATQAHGTILFFEKLFESRLYFVDKLIEMGARIIQCDPHRAVVSGPSRLYGAHLASPDIRAGMALVVAALCAKGESIIDNAEIIERGYEKIHIRLQRLGADITEEK